MTEDFIALNQSKVLLNELYSFKALNSRKANDSSLFGGRSFCIAISPDDNRWDGYLPNPYFKLCNADNIYNATGVSRICFRVPAIVQHTNQPEIKITTRLLEDLNKAIKYTYIFRGKERSVLEILNIGIYEMIRGTMYEKSYIPVTQIPDFNVLSEYKNESRAIDMYKNKR